MDRRQINRSFHLFKQNDLILTASWPTTTIYPEDRRRHRKGATKSSTNQIRGIYSKIGRIWKKAAATTSTEANRNVAHGLWLRVLRQAPMFFSCPAFMKPYLCPLSAQENSLG